MCDEAANTQFVKFQELLEQNVNDAVNVLIGMFHRAAVHMSQKPVNSSAPTRKLNLEWWDRECDEAKHNKSVKLNAYRRSGSVYDLNVFKESRTVFRRLCKRKAYAFKDKLRADIEGNNDNPNVFWKKVKQLGRKNTSTPDVRPNEWFDYFRTLLNHEVEIDAEFEQHVHGYLAEYDHVQNQRVNEKAAAAGACRPQRLQLSITQDPSSRQLHNSRC